MGNVWNLHPAPGALITVIPYLGTVYRAVKLDELLRPYGMDKDVREFFARPVPRAVWDDLRAYQDPDFMQFVGAKM